MSNLNQFDSIKLYLSLEDRLDFLEDQETTKGMLINEVNTEKRLIKYLMSAIENLSESATI